MEPPTNRPRMDPSLLFDQDDADDDELNLQPEQVNARRDPAYQLEKSRAAAEFKLKSAFESIFEKYERDFTGECDEIDLYTGEIVVNNGHIQSLKDADLESDLEDEDGGGEDAEALDEERILQGKGDDRLLSRIRGSHVSSMVGPVRAPKQIEQGGAGARRVTHGVPLLSSMMHPHQTLSGSVPMQYNLSGGMDEWVEPAWRAPELPPPPALKLGQTRTTTMKLLAGSKGHPPDEDGEDEYEDDILLGGSSSVSRRTAGAVVKKKRLSLPQPLGSASVSRTAASKSIPKHKDTQKQTQKVKKSAEKQETTLKTSKELFLKKPAAKVDSALKKNIKPTKNKIEKKAEEASGSGTAICKELVAVRTKLPEKAPPGLKHKNRAADIYVNHSSPGRRMVRKPKNQVLTVEIVVRDDLDRSAFKPISSEPSPEQQRGPELPEPEPTTNLKANLVDQTQGTEPRAEVAKRSADSRASQTSKAPVLAEKDPKPQRVANQETFSRHVLDPSYMFSDEDEPTLPKAKVSERRLGQKARRKSKGQKDILKNPAEESVQQPPREPAQEPEEEPEKDPDVTNNDNGGIGQDEEHPVGLLPENNEILPQPPPDATRNPPLPAPKLPTDMEGLILETDTREDNPFASLDVTGLIEIAPGDLVEPPPTPLLWRKPRRKRKIPVEFHEEPVQEESQTPSVKAPPRRWSKKQKQGHPDEVKELDMPLEEPAGQPDNEPLRLDDVQESDMPPEEPIDQLDAESVLLGEVRDVSVSPEEQVDQVGAEAPIGDEGVVLETSPAPLAEEPSIPESPQPIIPTPRTALLEKHQDVISHPVTGQEMDADSPLDNSTPLPNAPSPELGETGAGEDQSMPSTQDIHSTSPLPYSSPSKAVKVVKKKPKRSLPITPVNRKEKRQQQQPQANTKAPTPPSAMSTRSVGILSLLSDDEGEESDELSLTPRVHYYTPPNARQHWQQQSSYSDKNRHTSLTAPLQKMKLLSSPQESNNNPRTPSSLRKKSLHSHLVQPATAGTSDAVVPSSARTSMYFSADRRPVPSSAPGVPRPTSSSSNRPSSGGGIRKRKTQLMISALGGGQSQKQQRRRSGRPVSPRYDEEGDIVQTPGGTKRRCGEGGFRCERDFCFVCL